MPGPIQVAPQLPAWADPKNRSVFDAPGQGLLRSIVGMLGLDDPTQIMALGVPIETGAATGGALDAIASRFPRFAQAIKAYHGSPHDYNAERLIEHPTGVQEYIVGAPNVLPTVPQGAKVVRDFPLGRQRLDKIGTGEGAQVYGHGLYSAENPAVAEEYKKNLTASYPKFTHTDSDLVGGIANDRHDLPVRRAEIILSPTTSKDEALRTIEEGRSYLGERGYNIAKNWIDEGAVHWPTRTGKTYEVAIHAHPDHFLDWDKPLSEQSEQVQKALEGVLPKVVPTRLLSGKVGLAALQPDGSAKNIFGIQADTVEEALKQWTGERFYNTLGKNLWWEKAAPLSQKAPAASEALKQVGIPGIKYLDQASRTAGEGTRNYVVFDDKLVDIMKKYGILAAVAGGGAASQPDRK